MRPTTIVLLLILLVLSAFAVIVWTRPEPTEPKGITKEQHEEAKKQFLALVKAGSEKIDVDKLEHRRILRRSFRGGDDASKYDDLLDTATDNYLAHDELRAYTWKLQGCELCVYVSEEYVGEGIMRRTIRSVDWGDWAS
jgi:hypothetical protein